MNNLFLKRILALILGCLAFYLVNSFFNNNWELTFRTIRDWLILILIMVPFIFKEKLQPRKWLISILFAIFWAGSFFILRYIMGADFSLVRTLLMGVIGFVYTFFQLKKRS